MNVVENAIDELSRLGRAVFLGQVDVFIQGHFGGDGLEVEQFSQSHFHEDHVQAGDALRVPILEFGNDQTQQVFVFFDHGREQLLSKIPFVGRNQLLERDAFFLPAQFPWFLQILREQL